MDVIHHLRFWSKMSLVGVWFTVVTPVFTLLALPLWGRSWLGWAYAKVLSSVGLRLLGIRVVIHGREKLDRGPAVIVSNHQSNVDILLLGAVYPRNTIVIGKRELRKVPLFGVIFAASRNIMIDRRDRSRAVAGLDTAVQALRDDGMSIWIFPEGTRSRGKRLGAFKKGAFHMAVEAGVPIVPVVTASMAGALDISRRYAPGGDVEVHVLEPVATTGQRPADVGSLMLTVHALFERELAAMQPGGEDSVPRHPHQARDRD